MDAEQSSLNTSSLIDLKAELQKKYESFRNLKVKQNASQIPKHTTKLTHKGDIKKEKVIKQTTLQPKKFEEEDLNLKKSREALEKKAKLYENIVSNNILLDDEQKDNYLVDFQRKVVYNSNQPKKNEDSETLGHTPTAPVRNMDMHESILRQESTFLPESSKTQAAEDPDQPVHYQNIQFNEVRDHGTGYFAFSEDESKRKEQMEELHSLRQETEEQRMKNQRLQKKRKAMLQARLTKICERKNIDISAVKAYTDEPEMKEDAEKPTMEDINLSEIPLPTINLESETMKEETVKKEPKIRPWDKGKDNLEYYMSQKKIKTQDQWIEEKRGERSSEFAPPSFYR